MNINDIVMILSTDKACRHYNGIYTTIEDITIVGYKLKGLDYWFNKNDLILCDWIKEGNTVIIKDFTPNGKNGAVDEMMDYIGLTATITNVMYNERVGVSIDIDDGEWWWHSSLLEPIEINVGDTVRINDDIRSGVFNVVDEMIQYRGKVCTVINISDGGYHLDVDNGRWWWNKSIISKVDSAICNKSWPKHFKPNKRFLRNL